jgi:hypothetical protein
MTPWRIAVTYSAEASDKLIGIYNTGTGEFAPFGYVGVVSALDYAIEAFEAVTVQGMDPSVFNTIRPDPSDVDLLYYDTSELVDA